MPLYPPSSEELSNFKEAFASRKLGLIELETAFSIEAVSIVETALLFKVIVPGKLFVALIVQG